jgi:membrane protein DedA with SNARE-associated domain
LAAALSEWFHQHIYTAIFIATLVEGLGLPLPAEALFVAAGLLIRRGDAHLSLVVLLAAMGNLIGSFSGFMLAYLGGKKLLARAAEALRLKPEALREVDAFFVRYGPATIFISRFVGFIRAATIYSSGVARVQPWKFALYTLAGALIWNTGWAFLAFRFGVGLHRLIYHGSPSGLTWVAILVGVVAAVTLVIIWRKRRRTADS